MSNWYDVESEELSKMAVVYHRHHRWSEAETAYKLIIKIRKTNGDKNTMGLALTHHRLAALYFECNRMREAITHYGVATSIYEHHFTTDPSSRSWYDEAQANLRIALLERGHTRKNVA